MLRAFSPTDAPAVHDYLRRPDVMRFLYTDASPDLAATERLVSLWAAGPRGADDEGGFDVVTLAVTEAVSGRLIGDASLRRTSTLHRQGEIGFVIHPDARGRGLATEAAGAMVRLGFEALALHRIVGRCDARNTASAAVLARLGMRREAHLVGNEWVKGEWTDELVYALLSAEWVGSAASRC